MAATYMSTPLRHDAVVRICGQLSYQATGSLKDHALLRFTHFDFIYDIADKITVQNIEPDDDRLDVLMAGYYQKHADGWFTFPVKYRSRSSKWVSSDKQAGIQAQILLRLVKTTAARFKDPDGGY